MAETGGEALTIRVRLFAGLASAAGTREVTWQGEGDATPATVWDSLQRQFPALQKYAGTINVAVNREYSHWGQLLKDGDEVAFLTPVSGGRSPDEGNGNTGAVQGFCWITDQPLRVDDVLRLVSGRPEAGAVVLFAGTARRITGDRITEHLEYDAYREMAVSEMEKIAAEVRERWPGAVIAIVHRVGKVETGEASVLIAVSTAHRAEAFAAGRYAIDRLKETVPIWKKEVWADGEMWVGDVRHPGSSR